MSKTIARSVSHKFCAVFAVLAVISLFAACGGESARDKECREKNGPGWYWDVRLERCSGGGG